MQEWLVSPSKNCKAGRLCLLAYLLDSLCISDFTTSEKIEKICTACKHKIRLFMKMLALFVVYILVGNSIFRLCILLVSFHHTPLLESRLVAEIEIRSWSKKAIWLKGHSHKGQVEKSPKL